jgi:hypothetical protein
MYLYLEDLRMGEGGKSHSHVEIYLAEEFLILAQEILDIWEQILSMPRFHPEVRRLDCKCL